MCLEFNTITGRTKNIFKNAELQRYDLAFSTPAAELIGVFFNFQTRILL